MVATDTWDLLDVLEDNIQRNVRWKSHGEIIVESHRWWDNDLLFLILEGERTLQNLEVLLTT